MKCMFLLACVCYVFTACHNKESVTTPVINNDTAEQEVSSFFPVTTFLRGQLLDIKASGINPLNKNIRGNQVDSAWIKMEDLPSILAPFLSPVIDTTNVQKYYEEKKFLDQSLDAYTLTYDPKTVLHDTMTFQHWDVYVRPSDGKVTRIYLIKKTGPNSLQQLTWQNGEGAHIVSLVSDTNGKKSVEKEQIIKWSF